jgi:chromosome segregation ATPase
MKKAMHYLSIAAIIAGMTISGCQSKEKKAENAEQKVGTDQANMQAAKDTLNTEYAGFKASAEQKITDNDKKIERLKEALDRPAHRPLDDARRRKIADLEQRNADLRKRLEAYQSAQTDWATFKAQFDIDMDSLNMAYDELDKSGK